MPSCQIGSGHEIKCSEGELAISLGMWEVDCVEINGCIVLICCYFNSHDWHLLNYDTVQDVSGSEDNSQVVGEEVVENSVGVVKVGQEYLVLKRTIGLCYHICLRGIWAT